MKIILKILIFLLLSIPSYSKEISFFDEAKLLFEEKKYDKSKFLFQRNIVYNTKNAESYLYLAKIFNIEEDMIEEEKNINTVLLLDPKNEEAIYLLMEMELKRSNFSKVEDLKKEFRKFCTILCDKLTLIDDQLKEFDTKDAS